MNSNERDWTELLRMQHKRHHFVCVGLDSDASKLPHHLVKARTSITNAIYRFNCGIIEAVGDIAGAIKINVAFYEMHGDKGVAVLQKTIAYAHNVAPSLPIILDAKRGDIGNTNMGYVKAAFGELNYDADAITVHPYLGKEAMMPFLLQQNKGVIVLCKTSNPGAGEFQDLVINGEPLFIHVAKNVAQNWNSVNGNCAVVAGATYPDDIGKIRKAVGMLPILIPGIGKQGGDLEGAVKNGRDILGGGFIINSSREIIFASRSTDFAEAARTATEDLNTKIKFYA